MICARIAFWAASILAVGGFPFCVYVYLAASRTGFPSVDDDWGFRCLAIPVAVFLLSVLSLVFGRGCGQAGARGAREWTLGMAFASVVLALLLWTKFG